MTLDTRADLHRSQPSGAYAAAGLELISAGRRRISWGAVFAGVIVVLAVELLLSMLGIGIGLSLISPAQGNSPEAGNFGVGAGVWWGVSYLIALFVGGYVAARLAGRLVSWDGALHGILIWAFTLLVTFYLLGTAMGSVVGGAFSVLGNTLSSAGQGIRSAVPEVAQATGMGPERLQQLATSLLTAQPMNADPKSLNHDQAQQEIAANLPRLALGGDQAQAARSRIVAVMAAQLNISPDEANRRFDQTQAQFQQSVQQVAGTARRAADTAATGVSRASFAAFAALVLGAIAAAWGGFFGARLPEFEVDAIDPLRATTVPRS
jgi:hypothetical protein